MKRPAYYILRLLLMWMLLFMLARAGFLLMLFFGEGKADLSEWPLTFLYGLRLDLSTTAYLIALPALIWIIRVKTGKRQLAILENTLSLLLLYLVLIILLSNYSVYTEWATLLNARAIDFLQDPEGIIASLSTLQLITKISLLILVLFLFTKVYFRYIVPQTEITKERTSILPASVIIILIPVLIRGGLQEIPINESSAYFSESIPINDAATNPVWFLANNIAKRGTNRKNPYIFTNQQECDKVFASIINTAEPAHPILKINRPNIVLIILESWTSGVIAPLGGDKNTTPFFTSLCDSGLLFTNIYSSGRRTDQMFPSVLSGFPSIPNHSISRFTDKIRKLPILSADLRNAGYHTSFFYGGELQFANMNSYLLQGKFQSITGKDQFQSKQLNSKWGAHDEFLFEKVLMETQAAKQPFFNMVLTLSTHEPFEVPGKTLLSGKDEPEKFRNSAFYTDQCLQRFFTAAKEKAWYKNTLFILVADHGHLLPQRRDYYDPESYHIPLLWFGDVLQDSLRGTQKAKTGGQHDIAATLLNQVALPVKAYSYSRDLLKKYETEGTYLNFDKGMGWVETKDRFVYLFAEKQFVKKFTQFNSVADSSCYVHGKVFLQNLYDRFLKL